MLVLIGLDRYATNMKMPLDDYYFEKSSADGYAFLGIARYMLNKDWSSCFNVVNVKGPRLCANWINNGTQLNKNTVYAYTCWPIYEFYQLVGDNSGMKKIIRVMDDEIGFYEPGVFRYCDMEIDYVVPNVSATAALTYARHGEKEQAKTLIENLRKEQAENGNWFYTNKRDRGVNPLEDTSHLSMMVIALREIEELGFDTVGMVSKAIKYLRRDNQINVKPGSIGWGGAYLYLATLGLDEKLNKRAYEMCKKTIKHRNFRTRAITLWALVKGESWKNTMKQEG